MKTQNNVIKSRAVDIVTHSELLNIQATSHRSHIPKMQESSKRIVVDYRLRVYKEMIAKSSYGDLSVRKNRNFWTKEVKVLGPSEKQNQITKVLDHLSKVNAI